MTKKKVKMCPGYNENKSNEFGGHCHHKGNCPKNTNSKCQIIPAKPKVVKIKAWFIETTDGHISAWNEKRYSHKKPCTITIEAKYLKEKRK